MNAQTSTPTFTSALCLLLLCAASLLAGCPDFGDPPVVVEAACGTGSGAPPCDYCTDIKPIFDTSCARCHGDGPQGGQYPDLDVYAERNAGLGSVSTDLDSSLRRIGDGTMPPQGGIEPMVTARQLAIIEAWKAQGMPEGSCN
jgi:cytochrome c5